MDSVKSAGSVVTPRTGPIVRPKASPTAETHGDTFENSAHQPETWAPVKVDAWKRGSHKGKNDTLEGILKNQGYTLREIYSKGQDGKSLLQRVSSENGLKNPNHIRANQTLEILAKPKSEERSGRTEGGSSTTHVAQQPTARHDTGTTQTRVTHRATTDAVPPKKEEAPTRPQASPQPDSAKPEAAAEPKRLEVHTHPQNGAAPVHTEKAQDGPNALASVPLKLLPMGHTKYGAFGGLSWGMSADIGDASIDREADSIKLHTSKGDATVVNDPAHPGHIKMTVAGQTVTGVVQARDDGFVAKSDDGRSVELEKDGDHSNVHLHGFGSYDSFGLFLQRKP